VQFGVTIIDSASTLYLMGMFEDFQKVEKFVENLNFKSDRRPRGKHTFFEICIRMLGGLVGAHSLSG
jgi:hypothetical protein